MNASPVICPEPEQSKTRWNGALLASLKRVLADELQAGNALQSITAHSRDPETLLLVLARPFLRQPEEVQTDVRLRPATPPNASPIE
jgi:hypothetical protein